MTPNCYMSKLELKSAYRSVSLNHSQYPYTGLKWKCSGHTDFTYMYDGRLSFGAKLSVGIFHRLILLKPFAVCSSIGALNPLSIWMIFLIVGNDSEECQIGLNTLITIVRLLGFSVAWEKTLGPTQIITFLGVRINSIDYTLSLPEDKVNNLGNLLTRFFRRKRASCKQLQSLAGKLSWAAHVVNGGTIDLQRVLNIIKPLKKDNHKVLLTDGFRKDITWWLECLPAFNSRGIRPQQQQTVPLVRGIRPPQQQTVPLVRGIRPPQQQTVPLVRGIRPPQQQTVPLVTDACNQGGGMICPFDWAYVNWKRDMPSM